jgi:hypothetical protein
MHLIHFIDSKPAFLVDPRGTLAWNLSNLGAAISRLAHRIHDDAPGDYFQGHLDGQQIVAISAVAVPRTTREDVRRLLASVNLPSDDDALDRLGWKATA